MAMAKTFAALIALGHLTSATINEQNFCNTIHRDVAIVGAGASGTYAAIRLREDYNLSVIAIEKDVEIGGHVNTYIDPGTQRPVDYGVLSYWDYGPARDFFARMGVEVVPPPQDTTTTVYVDHETARNLSDFTAPAFPDVLNSIRVYGNESQKYNDILLPGYWNFPPGDAIPEDLLLPYGEFSTKYGLDNLFPMLQMIAGPGVGGVRNITTLYVMAFAFGYPAIQGLSEPTSFVPKSGSNSELYEKAYALLKDDVLLSSCIIDAERDDEGVRLVVRNADGSKTLIKAKKLLVTASPSVSNLATIDLDDQESAIFSSATPRPLQIGIIKTSAIPRDFNVQFISSAAAPDNYLDLYQDLPYDLKLQSAGPEGSQLFRALLETTYEITPDEAKTLITTHVQKLISAGTFDAVANHTFDASSAEVEFVTFINHNSVAWRRPVEELQAGFMQKLYALQGHRSTWYTGSLWCTDFSSNVWAFTDTVLERLVPGLK